MTARLLDGRPLARHLRAELAERVRQFQARTGLPPRLAIVQVGADPAAEQYRQQISRTFAAAGAAVDHERLPETARPDDLAALLRRLSQTPSVHGILLQTPLPAGFDLRTIVRHLDPEKDVDGLHPLNAGRLYSNDPEAVVPATPLGGLVLLEHYQIELRGRRAVVVGRSLTVGRPMAMLLLHRDATVTLCHSATRDLPAIIREAEIVVAALGRPHAITGEMLRPGAVVVDFGYTVLPTGAVAGDVDFASAQAVAGAITPVPGGTGPLTTVMLLRNLLYLAERHTPV